MSTRTSSTSSKGVSVNRSRFNQALDIILSFEEEEKTIKTGTDLFGLLDEGVVEADGEDEQTVTIHLDKLSSEEARSSVVEALGLPEGESSILIAEESKESFQSFLLALEIYERKVKNEIVEWILCRPLDRNGFFEKVHSCIQEVYKIAIQNGLKQQGKEIQSARENYAKAYKEKKSPDIFYSAASDYLSLLIKALEPMQSGNETLGLQREKNDLNDLEVIEEQEKKKQLKNIKVHKKTFDNLGVEYSSYTESLLERMKYEGVLGKYLVTRIQAFFETDKTDAQKKELAELLERLSSVSRYNHVQFQVQKKAGRDETLLEKLQEDLQKLKSLFDANETDVTEIFKCNEDGNCISPVMKSLQSIRVQKEINKLFKGKVDKPPFAAVSEVEASEDKIKGYKINWNPIIRPSRATATKWVEKVEATSENRERLMQFIVNRADGNVDFRNKIMISDPESYLKTLVNAEGDVYIAGETDLKKGKNVKITTRTSEIKTFDDGMEMPPVTITHYRRNETEKYACTQQFEPDGSLHVELTSPVTSTNKEKPEVAALEFARQLQRQALFSAPEAYSDVDRLAYLATFSIQITDLPEDISFEMMEEKLKEVGFGENYISQSTPERTVSATFGPGAGAG